MLPRRPLKVRNRGKEFFARNQRQAHDRQLAVRDPPIPQPRSRRQSALGDRADPALYDSIDQNSEGDRDCRHSLYRRRFHNRYRRCQSAFKFGSDSLLVQVFRVHSSGVDESGFKQVEFGAAIHLPLHELELGDLAFGLTVRPGLHEGSADSVAI